LGNEAFTLDPEDRKSRETIEYDPISNRDSADVESFYSAESGDEPVSILSGSPSLVSTSGQFPETISLSSGETAAPSPAPSISEYSWELLEDPDDTPVFV